MKKFAMLLVVVLAFLPGCQPKMDTAAVRSKIEEQDKKFLEAVNNKNLDGVMSVYWNSPDLVGIYPDGMFRGYVGVKRSWENTFSSTEGLKFEFTERRLVVNPSSVYEWGTFNFSITPKGAAEIAMTGRFLTVWEEKDGMWVITADHSSPTPVPPPAETSSKP
jgi:ketosteroid isomerase-like protein